MWDEYNMLVPITTHISHKVFLKSFRISQPPRRFVNLSFESSNVNNKLTNSCGNWLLQDYFKTLCVRKRLPLARPFEPRSKVNFLKVWAHHAGTLRIPKYSPRHPTWSIWTDSRSGKSPADSRLWLLSAGLSKSPRYTAPSWPKLLRCRGHEWLCWKNGFWKYVIL